MIAVDSSVWIDYFNGHITPQTDRLHAALGEQPIVIGDLVLTKVLQGFCAEALFRRALRAAGVTVRKTIDVMIGTYCIETQLPLLYSDRDFDPMVEHLHLKRA